MSCKLTFNIVAHLFTDRVSTQSPEITESDFSYLFCQVSFKGLGKIHSMLKKYIYMFETYYAPNILDLSLVIKNLTSLICSAYQKRGFPGGISFMK